MSTFFCETTLINPSYSERGVGAFTREIKKKFKNTTDIYDENCHSVVFTHPPPLRNNKDKYKITTFNLLKVISNANHHKKIIVIYDIIPHIFKDLYKPESEYYEYFEIIKKSFDIYICISNSTKNDLHKYLGLNLDKMIVIYPELSNIFLKNNIENIDISEKYNINKKYIISPLGADLRKNELKTITSFIKWNNPDYQLVLMYKINETQKKNLLSNIPSEQHHNIIFTGFVTDNDYKYLMQHAEFTLFISLYEGFGFCVMESIYVGTPVLTSNVGSTKELGLLSPSEILLCDPNDDNDIINKMDFLSKHLNEYKCDEKKLFNKCYNINNRSYINKLNIDGLLDLSDLVNNHNITIPPILNEYMSNLKYKQKIKFYNQNLDMKLYSHILNLFDINIQVRLTNGGGSSGCVTDFCFLNKFIVTNLDQFQNVIPQKYNNVILSNIGDDWKPIDFHNVISGFSEKDINQIAEKIINNISRIKSYDEGVNQELSSRLLEYPNKLMKFLNLTPKSNICFVTPYGSDISGISDFSYITIKELSNYMNNIDIYTDCEKIELNKQSDKITFYKIDEIQNNKDKYDEIIWVIGNSTFHNKMIQYGLKYGGTFLFHDETLYELYLYNKWVPNNLELIHPTHLREKGNNINNEYRCFHDICNNSNNKVIVHNQNLKDIILNTYNVKDICCIEYPNFNLNIFNKLTEIERLYYRKILEIDNNKLNILMIGGLCQFKLPYYTFKLLDKLNDSGIDTDLYIFFNK